MAYVNSNPPRLIAQSIGATDGNMWIYMSTDAMATVNTADYFTDSVSGVADVLYYLGAKVNDVIMVIDTDASPIDFSISVVNAVSATSSDISDGTEVAGSDSD